MGSYLNPGSERFQTGLRSRIYVDKTLLISRVNECVRTEQKFICVSRPRGLASLWQQTCCQRIMDVEKIHQPCLRS